MKSIDPTPDFIRTTMQAIKRTEEKKQHSLVRRLATRGIQIGVPLGACLFGFLNLFRFMLAAMLPAAGW